MFTIRATRKLLKRGADIAATQEPPTTVLGDWYANLVIAKPRHLVVAVSERTMLAVVVPAKDVLRLPQRVALAAREVLQAIGVPDDQVQAEFDQMQRAAFGKTASRSVLGGLNDFVHQLDGVLERFPDRAMLELSLCLSETPTRVIEGHFPDAATRAAFVADAAIRRMQSSV